MKLFNENLIAPCGMNCGVCLQHLRARINFLKEVDYFEHLAKNEESIVDTKSDRTTLISGFHWHILEQKYC